MPITTVNDEVDELRHLSRDYTDLLSALADGPPHRDADGLTWLSARILDTQTLTRRVLERLRALCSSDVSDTPEHLQALRKVAGIARDTTEAGLILTGAVTALPFAAAVPRPQPGRDIPDPGHDGHTTARRAIAEGLRDASRVLQSCATACLYAAAPLTACPTEPAPANSNRTRSAPATEPAAGRPSKLTVAQRAALQAIAAGTAVMYDSGRGPMRVTAAGGVRITMPTFEALRRLGLVDRDTSTSLYSGQKLYATAAGRATLAVPPATAAGVGPAPAPPPTERRR